MAFIDISRPLRTGSPHWPGDCPTELTATARMADGASCNVGRLALSLHNGTHVDAPYHYDPRGVTIEAIDPGRLIGPARVIDARGRATLGRDLFVRFDAEAWRAAPRILFRTDSWRDPEVFPSTWPRLEPGVAAWLRERAVTLVGLDVPSVDALESKDLPIHAELNRAGILILESLDLRDVEAGVYELIAAPLRIAGGDASPVRALLRKPESLA
jgi:arylformamidase